MIKELFPSLSDEDAEKLTKFIEKIRNSEKTQKIANKKITSKIKELFNWIYSDLNDLIRSHIYAVRFIEFALQKVPYTETDSQTVLESKRLIKLYKDRQDEAEKIKSKIDNFYVYLKNLDFTCLK